MKVCKTRTSALGSPLGMPYGASLMAVIPAKLVLDSDRGAGIQYYEFSGFRPRFRGDKHAPAEAGVRNDNPTNYKRQNTRHTLKMKKNLEQIAKEDSRFSPPAIRFVYEALGFTVKKITVEPRHVSGQTLCKGLKKLAIEKWGRMAMVVLDDWGIKTTRDFGEIVYLMIKYEWMSAQSADSIDDFNDVYDFKTVFKDQFEF